MMGHRLLLSSSRFRKVQHRLFLREYRRWNKEAKDTTWLIVVFQVAFFVAFYFGGKALGPNIIFVVIGLALLKGIAMFVCLVVVALDGSLKEVKGRWRKALMIAAASFVALVVMYFYSRLS